MALADCIGLAVNNQKIPRGVDAGTRNVLKALHRKAISFTSPLEKNSFKKSIS
ncbi:MULTISPECIES: hypothetical protein [unclassified Rhizobium]|uniref:hypothetical protein n=1 Tax=unclassified Rhizobium TaxID=2613769 RepID=UPI001300F62D|nr:MULTISPECIES: hypothetical protein [unclassified Rhizobium]MDM9619665.1 hypothetical protein [Rhizobium sp. S96]